jgi:urease accessory protein
MTMTTEASLYRLMAWLSPAYPVGAFSYSHGIEYAVEAGLIRTGAGLTDWIIGIIEHGAGHADAVFLAQSWRAAAAGDDAKLDEIVALARAWRGTAETALESAAQGEAFVAVTRAVWAEAGLERLARRHDGKLPLPAAVGAAAAGHEIPLEEALVAYLQGFSANLVSAGVRLIPLGQTEGQRIVAALEPAVARAARAAAQTGLDDLGTAAAMADWCSAKHETQYTRLFRS